MRDTISYFLSSILQWEDLWKWFSTNLKCLSKVANCAGQLNATWLHWENSKWLESVKRQTFLYIICSVLKNSLCPPEGCFAFWGYFSCFFLIYLTCHVLYPSVPFQKEFLRFFAHWQQGRSGRWQSVWLEKVKGVITNWQGVDKLMWLLTILKR